MKASVEELWNNVKSKTEKIAAGFNLKSRERERDKETMDIATNVEINRRMTIIKTEELNNIQNAEK